jgi:hypothetical protein
MPGGGLSTARFDIAKHHQEAFNCSITKTEVPSVTIDDVFSLCPSNTVHWLKIDVEGYEKEVLEGWRESDLRPWIIVIEATYPCSTVETHDSWEYLLLEKGYELVYRDGLNRFYLHQSKNDLRSRFIYPPNVFDNFQLSGTSSSMVGELKNQHLHELDQLRQQLESERAQTQALEQTLQQQAEQLQTQLAVAQQELLTRERGFTEQLALQQAREHARAEQARQDATARENQLQSNANLQLRTLRNTARQSVTYAQGLTERLNAMQATWWWRLSLVWRHPGHWPISIAPNSFLCLTEVEDISTELGTLSQTTSEAPSESSSLLKSHPDHSHISTPSSPIEKEKLPMPIQHITELFSLDGSAFVAEAYRSILHREPDAHGLSYYLGRLAQGHSKASVIYQLTQSSDRNTQHTIKGLDALVKKEKGTVRWFNRLFVNNNNEQLNSLIAMLAETNHRITQLNNAIVYTAQNKSPEIIREKDFAHNDIDIKMSVDIEIIRLQSKLEGLLEKTKIKPPWTAQTILDQDGEAFITAIYESILHRKPDESGKAHFLSEMQKGRSKQEILTHLLNCDEAKDQPDNFIYLNTKIDMAVAAIDGIWNHIKSKK